MRLAAVARTARLGPLAAAPAAAALRRRGPPAAFAASAVKREQQQPGGAAPGQRRGQGGGPAGNGGKGKGGGKGGGKAPEKESTVEELRAVRVGKVEAMREAGRQPFAYRFARTHLAAALHAAHAGLEGGAAAATGPGSEAGGPVAVAGRVVAKRVFGKLAFLTLRDDSGTIQLQMEKKNLEAEDFKALKTLVDVGDFVGATGGVRRTDKGELSVLCHSYEILTKSLLPLPDKFHGLQDVEKRYRQRYVDMIATPGVQDIFRTRAKLVATLRRGLEAEGFLEVETPVLQEVSGGADARPFLTFHNALDKRLSLRIATEIHLKKLVVGGMERVYELGRVFRNEGVSTRHNPEFTSIEVYQAYADYRDMLALTEALVRACVAACCGAEVITYQGTELDFAAPFRQATMADLVAEATGLDCFAVGADAGDLEARRARAAELLEARGEPGAAAKIRRAETAGHVLNELFEALVEKTLTQPTFVLEHPTSISPLAKPHRSKAGVTERFELFVYGRELANAFSELTDPLDQRQRFEQQIANHRARAAADADAEEAEFEIKLDEDFLAALEYGMPPTAGMGLGVDRLAMFVTDSASIRDVIPFPLLK